MKIDSFLEVNFSKKMKENKHKEKFNVSASIFLEHFGSKSKMYSDFMKELILLYDELKHCIESFNYFSGWINDIEKYYGEIPDTPLILNHIYLILLGKFILYLKIKDDDASDEIEISEIINGNFFIEIGILNLIEQDPSLFLLNPVLKEKATNFFKKLIKELDSYDFLKVSEDIFIRLYEDLVNKEDRVKTGEYYTPKWLVELTINESLSIWEKNNSERTPTLIDPACGSGAFIFHIIRKFSNKLTFEKILKHIFGFELNPLATFITKVNYILAGWFKTDIKPKNFKIPIYTRDTLTPPDILNFEKRNEKFDIIIGNPPWIVMRSIKSKKYQNFLKKEVKKYKLLRNKDSHLFTQMEMATLFFCKCANLYLKKKGVLSFVMPRSVIAGTMHHINFRKFQYPPIQLKKILDLENIKPLFNMPACVLISLKEGQTEYPILAAKYSGKLTERNLDWNEISEYIKIENYSYKPPDLEGDPSYYYDDFKVGASIFPRAFYFIDLLEEDDDFFRIKTSDKILKTCKDPWKIVFEGTIEREFIFSTILAMDLLPFGCKNHHLVILPIIKQNNKYKLLDLKKLKEYNFKRVYNWLNFVEDNWAENRTEKSESRFPSILDRLNYNSLLTIQRPNNKYTVLYNATGTNIVSFVVDNTKIRKITNNGYKLNVKDLIIEVKTWFYETDNEKEAHYLCAVFNSNLLNLKIKPLQPRGLGGARAIHRRPLLFPIPKFDENNDLHLKLVDISIQCHKIIADSQYKAKNSNGLRNVIREKLKSELDQIDSIVEKLID